MKFMNFAAISAAKIDKAIINKTLDTLNSGQFTASETKKREETSGVSDTCQLSRSVLSQAYEPKGTVFSAKG